jgi:hypothetical protein
MHSGLKIKCKVRKFCACFVFISRTVFSLWRTDVELDDRYPLALRGKNINVKSRLFKGFFGFSVILGRQEFILNHYLLYGLVSTSTRLDELQCSARARGHRAFEG